MNSFTKSISKEILLGKILGFIFFPLDIRNRTTLWDYFYCIPCLIFLHYCGVIVAQSFSKLLIGEGNTIRSTDLIALITIMVSMYWQILSNVNDKNAFRKILFKIDEIHYAIIHDGYASNVEKNRIFLWIFIPMVLVDWVLVVVFRSEQFWIYYCLYTLPEIIFTIQEYFYCKIVVEITSYFRYLNKEFSGLCVMNYVNLELEEVKKKCHLHKRCVDIVKELNTVTGCGNLINIANAFMMLCFACNYADVYFIEKRNVDVDFMNNSIFIIHAFFRLYYILYSWTGLSDEVSFVIEFQMPKMPKFLHWALQNRNHLCDFPSKFY